MIVSKSKLILQGPYIKLGGVRGTEASNSPQLIWAPLNNGTTWKRQRVFIMHDHYLPTCIRDPPRTFVGVCLFEPANYLTVGAYL